MEKDNPGFKMTIISTFIAAKSSPSLYTSPLELLFSSLHSDSPSMNVIACAGAAAKPPSMSPSLKTVRVVIKGRVQGVFFRDWTVENAKELGLNGWVRNRRDGSVEAVFSGQADKVEEMAERRCRVGPKYATVTGLSLFPAEEDPDPNQGFQRKPTA